jgi:two-component system cell cycle sensor histidine kinase/response regulator CckA
LAAGIAHDFNNILSIVKGSAQIIEDNVNKPDKVRVRVDRIKTVVEQGAGIVKAMLGFSADSGEEPAMCELNNVVRETIQLLGDRFQRDTAVIFKPATDLPEFPAVKEFIQQILLNFIFNAAEAEATVKRKQIILSSQRVQGVPKILVLAPAPAPEYVAVSVQDFGSGIPPEIMSRIFEPFFTTKALSARRGTGLGLSMVYELAKKLGAGLSVESIVDVGSTLTLILPVKELAAKENHK